MMNDSKIGSSDVMKAQYTIIQRFLSFLLTNYHGIVNEAAAR